VAAEAQQPPEHVRDVASEQAAGHVQLVDDDDLDLLEELEPLRVVRQDRGVEHVRVRDDDLAGAPDRRADRGRRIPVIGRGGDLQVAGPGKLGELGDLVLAEVFRREQEEGACRRIRGQRLEDGQRVAQGLARGGRGDDDDVLAVVHGFDGFRLVGVEGGDAAALEAVHDPRVQPLGKGRRDRVTSGEDGMVEHGVRHRRFFEQPAEHGLGGGRRIGPHRMPR